MKTVFIKASKFLTIHLTLFSIWAVPLVTLAVDTVRLENPLNNINSIDALLVAILNIIMVLMIPVIVFFIIYAGFKYVMAQGNASQVEEATRALTYAVIGGVLILGAVAISQIIQNVVRAF
jgi:Type IV secretion system pilin